eukprot:CAMPEP_0204277836 /NCGR_PEP_ID=MMETSP0468-20130131/29531_1 /ASSEMBLY_ACC=CAM_ASM_000383 /TAXON_ID=2969 /ORGANISM="Oxyrrhis marina" /LENGTH=145 /DNA_ID=CAMNT_0051254675 /DNA_START=34 /DNA_END=471 /DNA_ORIENTATION=+
MKSHPSPSHSGSTLFRVPHKLLRLGTVTHIRDTTPNICNAGHEMVSASADEVTSTPFFFGVDGGFTCSRCGVHSSNLTQTQATWCRQCWEDQFIEEILCCMCSVACKMDAVGDRIMTTDFTRRRDKAPSSRVLTEKRTLSAMPTP